MLESVTSRGPFTDQRIGAVINDLNQSCRKADERNGETGSPESFSVVFITMFPDVGRFRTHLMKISGDSCVWLSDHPNELRAFGKVNVNSGEFSENEFIYQHEIIL
jgi:hypothetical protein